MKLNRRFVLASGASLGALTLAGCGGGETEAPQSTTETQAGAPAETVPAEVALYDGSPVPALGDAAILNPKGLQDRPLGGKGAKVVVIEYASPTCPHCAAFHANVYPGLKSAYVDTGKVTFILRPFVRNVLDSVVFLLAESAQGAGAYYAVVGTYFETQSTWAAAEKPRDAMLEIALELGFTEESFEAALTNQELFDGMSQLREQAIDEFDLSGTPTFYINGTKLSGDKSLEELAAEIDPLLG